MRGPESLRRRIWLAIALVVGLAGILELALTILGKPPGAGPRGQADGGADTFVDTDMKAKAELACIEAGLRTLDIVRRMDETRGSDRYWRPSHGLGL